MSEYKVSRQLAQTWLRGGFDTFEGPNPRMVSVEGVYVVLKFNGKEATIPLSQFDELVQDGELKICTAPKPIINIDGGTHVSDEEE